MKCILCYHVFCILITHIIYFSVCKYIHITSEHGFWESLAALKNTMKEAGGIFGFATAMAKCRLRTVK